MSLTSLTFFIFLTITLILYYIIPKKFSYILLLISSVFFLFYNRFSIDNLIYVILIFLTSYISGILIDKNKSNKKGKSILIIGILIIVLELFYLKYTNLIIGPINYIFNLNLSPYSGSFPIGMSYYSLMMIGYMINVYWGSTNSEKNPFKTALFMTYFPILTSGPFINYGDIKENLFNKNKFNSKNIIDGILRIIWGIFKVLVISSRIAIYVNSVYSNTSNYNGILIFVAALLYTLQLYTNFSGSIDIIIGVSKLFGILLPENFNNPFSSATITEFWRRWHITLGNWLKNYIFYPILKSETFQKLTTKCKEKFGKNGKKIPIYIAMLILWLTIGIWHGGEYKYILASGILQFIFILIEDLFGSANKPKTGLLGILRIIRTFILFSISMVFFRASSISEGFNIIKSMFSFTNNLTIFDTGLKLFDLIILLVSITLLFIVDNKKEKNPDFINDKKLEFKIGLILTLVIIILVFGIYGIGFDSSDFIYSKF